MTRTHHIGQLYLNNIFAGEIVICGWEGAWGFGEFLPSEEYQSFATLFDEWSRLMHSDDSSDRIGKDVSEQLRRVENAMYRIHARLFLKDSRTWREIAILNIDRNMIEWKEQWSSRQSGWIESKDAVVAVPAP